MLFNPPSHSRELIPPGGCKQTSKRRLYPDTSTVQCNVYGQICSDFLALESRSDVQKQSAVIKRAPAVASHSGDGRQQQDSQSWIPLPAPREALAAKTCSSLTCADCNKQLHI